MTDEKEPRALCWYNIKKDGKELLEFIASLLAGVISLAILFFVPRYIGNAILGPATEDGEGAVLWCLGLMVATVSCYALYYLARLFQEIYKGLPWAYNRYYPTPTKCLADEAEDKEEAAENAAKEAEKAGKVIEKYGEDIKPPRTSTTQALMSFKKRKGRLPDAIELETEIKNIQEGRIKAKTADGTKLQTAVKP